MEIICIKCASWKRVRANISQIFYSHRKMAKRCARSSDENEYKSDYVYDMHKTNVRFGISIQSHCHKPFIGQYDIEKSTQINKKMCSHHRLRQWMLLWMWMDSSFGQQKIKKCCTTLGVCTTRSQRNGMSTILR